jgi:RNA polymerase sigma-70 factor (ECF subfamily)
MYASEHLRMEIRMEGEPCGRRKAAPARPECPPPAASCRDAASGRALPLPRGAGEITLVQALSTRTEWDKMESGGLQQLFATVRAELTHFLQARGMSREDAEDLLQDLYVKIVSTQHGPVSAPKAYLYRMVNNLAHDRRRAEASRMKRDRAWTAAQSGQGAGAERRMNPEELLQARDYLRRVDAVLDELPERTSLIFRRFRIEGESQKAIANSLDISLSAVEKHLQRAYRVVLDLRHRLDQSGPASPGIHEGGCDARSE